MRPDARGRSILLALLGPLVWSVPWFARGAHLDPVALALIVVFCAPVFYIAALTELESKLSLRRRAALVIALAGVAGEAALATWGGFAAVWLFFLAPILLLGVALVAGRPDAQSPSNALEGD